MRQKILFTILSLFLVTGVFAQNADLRLLEYVNGPLNSSADKSWEFVSKKSFLVDGAVPVSLLVIGFIENNKELKIKGLDAGASILIAGGGALVLKEIVRRDRPFIAHPNDITAKVRETGYSFPSGHTSLAFATATSLSMAFPKWYVIAPSFVYASAVGYSRMYLGVHYPSDVLGGALIGIGSSYFTFKAQEWLDGKKKDKVHKPL